ncbi:RecQ family ATP-dependent DNA helicase [soil metagenome]
MYNLKGILEQYWQFTQFRPLQEEIIQAVMDGHDALAILPTGAGKSICYQVPAMALPGICIVVTPLIALMKDQVANLKKRGIKSIAVHAGMTREEIDIALDNAVYGNFKFLYLSPERLTTDILLARLQKMKVNLFAVDEAHCISQWGYDFRPAYLNIADVRPLMPGVPILALTASATPKVKEDIQVRLQFENQKVFQASFARPNISFVVRRTDDKMGKILQALKSVQGLAIIYVRSRRKTQEVADMLGKKGIRAAYYHAGMSHELRSKRQEEWLQNKLRVMVCTNAFGMGIDKPDVRTVIHLDLPENIESYYQEAGRGGRDGKHAFALLLYNLADENEMRYRLENQFPSPEEILAVYVALGNLLQLAVGAGAGESFPLDLNMLTKNFNLQAVKTVGALKILEQQGLLSLSEAVFMPSRIKFITDKEELYKFQIANKKFDPFIKLLLRTYPGLFEEFTVFKEFDLAQKASLNLKDIQNYLHFFKKAGLIEYLPQTDQPQVTYLQPRESPKYLKLDKQFVLERKSVFEEQVKTMLGYALNTLQCRSQYILSYFGEIDSEPCGQCDICKEGAKPEDEGEALSASIMEVLKAGPTNSHELIVLLPQYTEDAILTTLRHLLDLGSISLTEDNQLTWLE